MTRYEFYTDDYGGDTIPEAVWGRLQRDADVLIRRYERNYTVRWPIPDERQHCLCAIADAMYVFEQLQSGNGPLQSASVGSVSESVASGTTADTSPEAQTAEYYRCLLNYAEVYRGC